MSTLSGQTIQSTYQGLLKLANSTSGITSDFQNVEDGLGNTTGLRLKQGMFDAVSLLPFKEHKAKYYGVGLSTAFGTPTAVQNLMNAFIFADTGLYSYSAVTFTVGSATTTSDTFEFSFYSPQMTTRGLAPYQKLLTEFSIDVTSTGLKTYVFPSPISFSATPGFNFLLYKISNSGVTPTARVAINVINPTQRNPYTLNAGLVRNLDNTAQLFPFLSRTGQVVNQTFSGTTTFDNTYDGENLLNTLSSTIAAPTVGFILHTI